MEPSETLKHLAVAVLFVVAIMVNGTTYLHGANAVVIPPSQGGATVSTWARKLALRVGAQTPDINLDMYSWQQQRVRSGCVIRSQGNL